MCVDGCSPAVELVAGDGECSASLICATFAEKALQNVTTLNKMMFQRAANLIHTHLAIVGHCDSASVSVSMLAILRGI